MANKTIFEDYEGFVKKFEPKKTTDDCYTPQIVYDAILGWLKTEVDLAGADIVRPFHPGGDYENYDYKANTVVVDNPPFSIISQIVRFYEQKGVRYFLFAPHLTLFCIRSASTYICTSSVITYDNDARVNTDFVSNLFGDIGVLVEPKLYKTVKEANKKNIASTTKQLPKYRYPRNVLQATSPICNAGGRFEIPRNKMHRISALQSQKKTGHSIFGGGYLIDDATAIAFEARQEQARQEQARQEQARQEQARQERIEWELSAQELAVIDELNRR